MIMLYLNYIDNLKGDCMNNIPDSINGPYEVFEWRHACAILKEDFPEEWKDILDCLANFKLKTSSILKPGGSKTPIAGDLDTFLYKRDWKEKAFDIDIKVDNDERELPTHKIDCFKNKIGLEIEWNNKDPFFDRDLNNFRLLHDLGILSVGVIITRSTDLQKLFNSLGKGKSYGTSTTHMGKLIYRIKGNGGGGCPIIAFGITDKLLIHDTDIMQ